MTLLDLSDYNPSDDLSTAETMPARWYTDPTFLELEAEKIFYKTWCFSVLRENGVHHFQSLVHEFLTRD